MLKVLNRTAWFVALCAFVIVSFPAQAGGKGTHRRDKDDDQTRVLFQLEGTDDAVADFLKRYKDSYEDGYPLRVSCDFPKTLPAPTAGSHRLVFVCDPTDDVVDQVSYIYNQSVHSLSLATSTVTDCSNTHCHTNKTAGCNYYSGPFCTTPGCYHTGYYCAGVHSCIAGAP
jgi:hypothetical protein